MRKCDGTMKEMRKQEQLKNIEYKISTDENSRKIFQCMRCDKNFNYIKSFNQHFYTVHREKSYKCKQCKKLFPHRFNLKNHLKVCLDETRQKIKCDKCNKSFSTRTTLEVHRWNCGKTKEFKCDICDTAFKSPYVVQVHFYQSHKEKKFKCETCSETFAVKKRLKSHEEKCGAKDGHNICNKCEKAFRTAKLLRTHTIQMHEGKKFKCAICGKGFILKDKLKAHMAIHSNDRPFKCRLGGCGFASKTLGNLKKHEEGKHTQRRRYPWNNNNFQINQNYLEFIEHRRRNPNFKLREVHDEIMEEQNDFYTVIRENDEIDYNQFIKIETLSQNMFGVNNY